MAGGAVAVLAAAAVVADKTDTKGVDSATMDEEGEGTKRAKKKKKVVKKKVKKKTPQHDSGTGF